MASQASLAIRRNEAYGRIEQATKKLAKGLKVEHSSPLNIRHRDPMVEQVQRIENVADVLDTLVKAQSKAVKEDNAQPPATVETVKEGEMQTVETVETVPVEDAPNKSTAGTPKGKAK